MVKRIAVALILAASAFSQAHAEFDPAFLIGKWEVFGPDGKQVGTYEFGPMKGGLGTMILAASIRGETRVFTMKYEASFRGNETRIKPVADGRDDLDCITVEFMSADAARVRQHGCTAQPSGPTGTIRRTGPSDLR